MDREQENNPDVVEGELDLQDVSPDWKRQKLRIFCPCVGTAKWIWCRTGWVVSLGRLFLILGSEGWHAAQIYVYYLSLRIVAMKRRKTTPGGSSIVRPGSASQQAAPRDPSLGLTGQHHAGTSPAAVKREFNRRAIVEEYAVLHGERVPLQRKQFDDMFNLAVRYIHMNLLQDLSPPWITKKFTQAVPGDGLLAQCLMPTFLQWDVEYAKRLFGYDVMDTFEAAADKVSLSVAGVLARPLYVCMNRRMGVPCLSVASMSPLLERFEGHRPFMCGQCAKKCLEQPVSDSTPLHMMRLYILVHVKDAQGTPMRTKPMQIIVHAPPNDVKWAVPNATDLVRENIHACPTSVNVRRSSDEKRQAIYKYDEVDSLAIWKYSAPFRVDRDQTLPCIGFFPVFPAIAE